MKRFYVTLGIVYGVSIILTVLGITVGVLWSSIYQWVFKHEMELSPSSTNYNLWKETPIPMYLKLYMFNWTNPYDFDSNDTKPNFVEMGPYVFREVDYKVNQVWNDNGTVTFQRRRVWHFDESLSHGSLSDKITNLNPVAATLAYTVRDKGKFMRTLVNRLLLTVGERLVITRTVRQLLFDGYKDTLLELAQRLNISIIPFTKFGWFVGRNGSDSYDGTFNMDTGTSNLNTLGIVKEWNFNDRSKFYSGPCARIHGTNGDLWPPLPDNETVSIFVSDICTALDLTYENMTTYEGLEGKKYISDESMLDNGNIIKSRKCYCHSQGGICPPSGVLDVSACKYNAPAFVSLPHFYLADESYRNAISGMHPTKEKHQMSLVVEPTTGVPLQVQAQLQLNLLLQPDEYMSLFKNVTKVYVPMLWFTQEARLTSDLAGKVKFLLILPSFGAITAFGVAAIGVLIFFIGVFICVRRKWHEEEGQVLLAKNENNVNRADE